MKALIDEAEKDVGEIQPLVFPKAALSTVVFRESAARLA